MALNISSEHVLNLNLTRELITHALATHAALFSNHPDTATPTSYCRYPRAA